MASKFSSIISSLKNKLPNHRDQPPAPLPTTQLQSKVVFTSTNNVGTDMRYSKSNPTQFSSGTATANIGTCAALSTLWLANMCSGTNPASSQPNQSRAALIFGKNWITKQGDARVTANIQDAGLRRKGDWNYESLRAVFEGLSRVEGAFLIDLYNAHYIAAVIRLDNCFLYDPNIACWSISRQSFSQRATEFIKNQGWPETGDLIIHAVDLG